MPGSCKGAYRKGRIIFFGYRAGAILPDALAGGIKMKLDQKTIMSEFIMLAELDESEAPVYESVVLEAMKKTETALDHDKVRPSDLAVCEHLAACEAVYELALIKCAGERYIVTAGGRAGQRLESLSRVEAAEKLREEARARAAGLLCDEDFVFALADG